MNTRKIVTAPAGNDDCPADALMSDFRKKINASRNDYSKNIEISDSAIGFWKDHADYIIKNAGSVEFIWDEIEEEQLPPLKIKVVRKYDKWYLSYLKEYGEETTLIQGKRRKGRNKEGSVFLDKEIEHPKSGRKL